MAQEFDKILGLLEEIKALNTANKNNTDDFLDSINTKMCILNHKDKSSLCKSYYDELIQSIETAFTTTSSMFHTNETTLKEIYDEKQQKYNDPEKFDNILSKNIHDFFEFESNSKDSLKQVKTLVSSLKKAKHIQDSTGKINAIISQITHDYEKITNEAFKDLEILYTDLNNNEWKKKSQIKKHTDNIQKSLKTLINSFSHETSKYSTLKNILLNMITGENLKITQFAINTVAEKIDSLYKQVTTKNSKKNEKENPTELKQLTKQTEELANKTNGIKQALGKITQNIDSLPDMKNLEDSIQDFYVKLEKLAKNIAHTAIKVDVYDISSKVTFLKEDFSTIRNIVKDLNDVLSSRLKTSIKSISSENGIEKITENITKIISATPKKEDIKRILSDKKTEEKESINELKEITEELTQRIDNISETAENTNTSEIPAPLNIVETKIDNEKLDKEFDNIYGNNVHLDNWLVNSNIKEKTEKIENKESENKKDLSNILKTTEQIVEKLESITKETENAPVQQDSNITVISDIQEKIDYLRNEILNTQNLNHDELITKIAELETSVTGSVSAKDFINFTEDLQDVLNILLAKSENTDLLNSKDEILKRLDDIDFSLITETILKEITPIQEFIETSKKNNNEINDKLISITEDLKNDLMKNSENFKEEFSSLKEELTKANNQTNNFEDIKDSIINKIENINFEEISDSIDTRLKEGSEDIKNELADLKELIANKKSDFEELNQKNNDIISSIDDYFEEIKNVISNIDITPDKETLIKLENIENDISEYRTYNDDKFEQISEKIEEYEKSIDEKYTLNQDLLDSISEISTLKNQIINLKESFDSLSSNKDNENAITEFVSSKLDDLNTNLDKLSNNIENGVQQGFISNSELLEEKTNALLSVIKELRHSSTNNIELFERLTVTDNKLMDFQQELELVNTDVKNILSSKTETIIEGLEDIKNILKENTTSQTDLEEIKELIKNTNLITQEKISAPELASSETIKDYEKFNELYENINQKIEDTENNIRDFILGDIDSVIIKIDNIKDYLTGKFEPSTLTENGNSIELSNFISEIEQFKQENKEYFKQIETSIENISSQNSDIISAIEDLRKTFNDKIKRISHNNGNDDIVSDPTIIEDLQNDLNQYADKIEALSGQNTDIEYILNDIAKKFENITVDGSISGKELSETINSNIEKLLTEVKKDWIEEVSKQGSNGNINTLMKEINDKIDILALTTEPDETLDNEEIKQLLNTLNTKIDVIASNDNFSSFDEIKESIDNVFLSNYTKEEQNNELKELLQTLNNKVDVMIQSDSSERFDSLSDSDEQITSMLKNLNNKIDILAQSDSSEKIDILSDSDVQITSMLETLNHKIDIIADSNADYDTQDNFEEIRDLIIKQKDYIDKLEPSSKLDAFKKCLEELTNEVNGISSNIGNNENIQKTLKDMKESIMDAVVSIFNQVSFVEETEDIKDFVEEKTDRIAKDLEEVTKQIKQIASSEESEDYTYSMQDIETDLAKLRIALNDLQNSALGQQDLGIEAIADSLNKITSSVDLLTQDEIQDLKTDITNLKEQTKHLLLSSDASFTTLNTDIIGKVDNVTQLLEKSNDSDKVMRQALIYMGEWIDSASQSMNKISSNSEEIINVSDGIVSIKDRIENLKELIPSQEDVLNSIEDKFEHQQKHLDELKKRISKIEDIEAKFEEQEERIDRLETNLEKILSLVEDIDNNGLMKKVDKIDKQIAKLSTNIEKLASYVD